VPLDRERYLGLAHFRYALRRLLAASERISGEAGVTSPQYQAMLAIGVAASPLTMKDLAEELMLQPHAAVQMVDRLQKQRLVERLASPADGRSVLLALTEQGEARVIALAAQHLDEMLKQEPQLSDALKQLKTKAKG
jgi:DNA-binding MarR family transcriptional regulator